MRREVRNSTKKVRKNVLKIVSKTSITWVDGDEHASEEEIKTVSLIFRGEQTILG